MSTKNQKLSRRDFVRAMGLAGFASGLTFAPAGLLHTTARIAAQGMNPVRGGRLIIGMNGDTKTLDPHVSQLWVWQNARRQIFEQLLRNNEVGEQLPFLATDFQWVDDVTLEVTLRTDVVFHNGEPFTAEDVKYTFDRLSQPDLPSEYVPRVAQIEEITVIAPDKVAFTLEKPNATFPGLLADIDIISRSISEDDLATTPVGTGPFRFVEWLPNERILFARFDGYREEGLPYLDEIDYRPIPDPEGRIASLLSGDIDVNLDIAAKDIQRLEAAPGINVTELPGGTMWIFYLNLTAPPFDNPLIRQAILYGFNRQQYIEQFMNGLARVTNTPIAPTNFAYNADVETMYPFDPERAAALLADAGHPNGEGLEIEIIYPVGIEEYKTISEFFQSQMADLGVTVKITAMELAAWSNKIVKERDYQIAFDGRGISVFEPATPYNDTTFTKPDEANFNGFFPDTIPGYLDLIEEGVAETNQARRTEIYNELQRLWAENLPGIILFAAPNFLVTRDHVMDYDAWGVQPFRLFETWLNK